MCFEFEIKKKVSEKMIPYELVMIIIYIFDLSNYIIWFCSLLLFDIFYHAVNVLNRQWLLRILLKSWPEKIFAKKFTLHNEFYNHCISSFCCEFSCFQNRIYCNFSHVDIMYIFLCKVDFYGSISGVLVVKSLLPSTSRYVF